MKGLKMIFTFYYDDNTLIDTTSYEDNDFLILDPTDGGDGVLIQDIYVGF